MLLKETCKPGGVTPLPPIAPRIPLGRPPWTGPSAHFGSKIAVQLFGRGPWALIGPRRKFKGGPWALLDPKPSLFYLPGMPPRPLRAKTRIIKKPNVLVIICNGTYLGRSRGTPLAPKKNWPMVPGAPRDPQGATTRFPGSPQGPPGRENHHFFERATPPWSTPGALL